MKASDFELLLPVGQKEMAEAAIHNGADAIYVGFPGFNARGRSYDFEIEELRTIIQLCHLYGVKVNLAFNIVIFENELPLVIEAIRKVLPLKPDALIVQDLGLVQLVKEMCPEQTVHASTQMTITNDLAIDFLSDLQIRRFVLGRENSLGEIKLIAERTKKELEVFVHGALCVSYSGQCFTSETLGGRSANRGQCAQSCRFSYDLIVDGEKKNLVDRTYLVSPQDLCGIAEIPELMRLGVKSFKVEGRLKSPEYVAQVAKSFRHSMDQVLRDRRLSPQELDAEKTKMGVEYSRGFFPGWLNGVNHQDLVNGTFSSHRGVEIGRIRSVSKNSMVIELKQAHVELENGDGLSWFEAHQKSGGSIYSIRHERDLLHVEFANSVQPSSQSVGSAIYWNHDKSQKRDIEKSVSDRAVMKRVPLKVSITLREGDPLTAKISDCRFDVVERSESRLSPAQKKPLSREILFDEMNSLGGSVFQLAPHDFSLAQDASDALFLNHKEIKSLRQRAIQKLQSLRAENKVESMGEVTVLDPRADSPPFRPQSLGRSPALHILLRNKQQSLDLLAAIDSGGLSPADIGSVCLDYEFGRDYDDSVMRLRSAGVRVGIATTRILKPQEYLNLKVIHSLNPDFILVRNLGALQYFQHVQKFNGELKGDFSLNVTNHRSFNYLTSKGLDSVCLSYDLNSEQVASLLAHVDASRAEVTIHQSMPSFHMEHCVFAAFLSKGKSYKDCGKPCEKHKVQLKDQFGNYHWIKPDQECRNTMYNSSAQTALAFLESWRALGLGNIRYEALHEAGEELIRKIKNYVEVLKGERSVAKALEDLKATETYGLSARQLDKGEEYKARKKDHSFL